MSASAEAMRFDDDSIGVDLSDGRAIAAPLAWLARLMNATAEQHAQVEVS